MFGWLRKQAAQVHQARQDVALEAANDTHQFMLRVSAALGAMPREMLADPFIIGAIASHAAILSKVITGGQSPEAVTENAMVSAVQLSFSGSSVSKEDALGALYQFKNHPEYTKATQVVTLILAARFGRRDLASDPLLLEARRKVKSMPAAFRESFGSTEEEQTATQLSQELFTKPLREKYGQLWSRK